MMDFFLQNHVPKSCLSRRESMWMVVQYSSKQKSELKYNSANLIITPISFEDLQVECLTTIHKDLIPNTTKNE